MKCAVTGRVRAGRMGSGHPDKSRLPRVPGISSAVGWLPHKTPNPLTRIVNRSTNRGPTPPNPPPDRLVTSCLIGDSLTRTGSERPAGDRGRVGRWAASTGVPFVAVHCPLFLPLGTSQKQTRLDTTQSQKQPHLDMTVATQSPEHDRRACFVLFHPANTSIGKVPSPALLLSGFLTGTDGTRVVPISRNWPGLHVPGSLTNTPMVPVIGAGNNRSTYMYNLP